MILQVGDYKTACFTVNAAGDFQHRQWLLTLGLDFSKRSEVEAETKHLGQYDIPKQDISIAR